MNRKKQKYKIVIPRVIRRFKRRLRRRLRQGIPHRQIFAFLSLIVVIICLYSLIGVLRTADFKKYYGTQKVLFINITNEEAVLPSEIKYENGEIYLPFDLVKENIDGNIYRTEEKDRIIITTPQSVIRLRSEDNKAYLNGNALELNMPVYDTEYLPSSVLEQFYPVDLSYNEENNTLTLTYTDRQYLKGTIKKATYLKYTPEGLSLNVRKLKKGDEVKALAQGDKYTLVTTSDGLCGYILTSRISDMTAIEPTAPEVEPKQVWTCTDGKANIVFDQVTNSTANTNYERIPIREGVDVICPTWFSFENTNGDIRNLADRAYVDNAHKQGIKVWGLLTDNFSSEISHAVLSDPDTREHVIKQLLAYSSLYNLDGINIDFEAVPKEDGELFVQFLRELAPMLHNEGLTLSADFFVPKAWTYHYQRGKCAEVLDYVIVMGYDQHYSGSDKAGSNAEISWSREAITATLAQNVPKEKLILGIPFYTRVWTINNETGELSQKAMGMKAAKDFMTEKGGIIKWNEEAGQNYAEVKDAFNTYKCWFEDTDSLKLRLELVWEYDIAGTAAWKSGLETSDVWGVLKDELKK